MWVPRVPAVLGSNLSKRAANLINKNIFLGFCVLTVKTVLPFNQKHKSFLGWAFMCVCLIECVREGYGGNGKKSQRAEKGLGTGQQIFSAPLLANLISACH